MSEEERLLRKGTVIRERWRNYNVYEGVPGFISWFLENHPVETEYLSSVLEKPWKHEELFAGYEEEREREHEEYLREEARNADRVRQERARQDLK